MKRWFCLNTLRSILLLCLLTPVLASCSFSSLRNLSPFSSTGQGYNGGAWSPNGQWFAASPFPSNTTMDSIQLFSSNGMLGPTLSGCDFLGLGKDYSWLPDGRISCLVPGDIPQLQMMHLNRRGDVEQRSQIALPLAPTTLVYVFQWNPRHFWLAILADKVAGEHSPTLYMTDLKGHNLVSPLAMDADQLAWSPDGTTLAVTPTGGGNIILLTVQQQKSGQLAIIRTRTLAAKASDIGNLAWSPSGRWLVCRHASYKSEDYLFLAATDGSGKTVQITSSTTDGQLDFPAWSPDGKQLIVAQINPSGNVLMSLDIVAILKAKGITP